MIFTSSFAAEGVEPEAMLRCYNMQDSGMIPALIIYVSACALQLSFCTYFCVDEHGEDYLQLSEVTYGMRIMID